jgi:hypothetical protein
MKHIPEFILILFLSYLLSSCTDSGPALNPLEVLPISTQVPAATETATKTTTATENITATPTEVPLFTEAEVEAANPFDDSTWPDIFKQTQEHPETATERAWQDENKFVLAVREKAGIPTAAESNNYIQSLSNAMTWEQTHPDEVKAGKKVTISPVEYREMIKESKNFTKRISLSLNDLQGYNFENIGPILGQNLDAERRPFDEVSGKLAGFGTIGGQDIILIETEDIDGHNILFPAVIYVEKGSTLPKGSRCVVTDLNYSDRHGGDSTYTLQEDIDLPPLKTSGTLKVVLWESLYDTVGKTVTVYGGYSEAFLKTGISEIHAFSPVLNLEMASQIYIHTQ